MWNRIKDNFDRQGLMQTLGATLTAVESGKVKITCIFRDGLSQQHGFFHAGVLTSLVDSACGYAALTLMPEEKDVLTVEFKVNFLKPASTSRLVAVGQVLQAGKTLTVCEGWVFDETEQKTIAKMTATMMSINQPK